MPGKTEDAVPLKIIALTLFLSLVFTSRASAYLDPGTGSYMLQLLIAGIASGLVAIKVFWNNITVFFKKLFRRGKKGGT
jgi:hypothetical protein